MIQLNFEDIRNMAGFYSVCSIVLYLITVLTNFLVITVVLVKKELHEPMYIFSTNLLFNGIIVSTAFLPKLTADILSESKTISIFACYCQMYFMQVFILTELALLTVMAYDRYVAICKPLRYSSIMTLKAVRGLSALPWLYSVSICNIGMILCTRLQLCSFTLQKPYCDYYSILKLSCTDYFMHNVYGIAVAVVTAAVPLSVIIHSYSSITHISLQLSKESRMKAFHTCLPHLLVLALYVIGVLFMAVQQRLSTSNVPSGAHTFLSLEFLIVPPLANPIIYGLRTKQIRSSLIQFCNRMKNKT
ncbi:putative gustatory receptor clone PTE03 [Protopterus annectens]|uniref:putative gustatory receptor clone PTE03 n=1 Tax=Protopterus annectens TaxID=7888 RepID=UPI001CFAAD9B|nr:putative gustatory receptor clone PTE03 [Protopterus annectens]